MVLPVNSERQGNYLFGSKNQYATIVQIKLRGKDAREQDKNHTLEIEYEVPLTHDLADEILPAMARDLFNKVEGKVSGVDGSAWEPKPEVAETTFNILLDPQLMEVRQHPDLDPVCRQSAVTVRKVVAYKAKAGNWMLSFLAGFVISDLNVIVALINCFKQGVYLSFQAEEPKLDLSAPGAVIEGSLANAPEPERKRRGRKALPESTSPESEGGPVH